MFCLQTTGGTMPHNYFGKGILYQSDVQKPSVDTEISDIALPYLVGTGQIKTLDEVGEIPRPVAVGGLTAVPVDPYIQSIAFAKTFKDIPAHTYGSDHKVYLTQTHVRMVFTDQVYHLQYLLFQALA
jgi:hypothetical protein